MVEINDNISNASNDKPNNPHLGADFEMWLKGREEQKNFLAQKSHLDARSQLADLNENILEGKGVEKKAKTIPVKNTDIPSSGNNGNKISDFSALSSFFNTRRKSDEGKGVVSGFYDSLVVMVGAVGRIVPDAFELASSPRSVFRDSVAQLKDLDPNIEIV